MAHTAARHPPRTSAESTFFHCCWLTQRRHTFDKDGLTSPRTDTPLSERGKLATGIGAQSFRFAPRSELARGLNFAFAAENPLGSPFKAGMTRGRSSAHLNPSGDATGPQGSPVRRSRPQCLANIWGRRRRALCERQPVDILLPLVNSGNPTKCRVCRRRVDGLESGPQ